MNNVTLVEYKRCSTCRKAFKWLEDNGIAFEDRSIVDDVPTVAELAEWQERSGLPVKRFFNTCGMAYRSMNLKDRFAEGITDEDARDLLAQDGMLIKRPILVTPDTVIPGFREKEWAAALGIEL